MSTIITPDKLQGEYLFRLLLDDVRRRLETEMTNDLLERARPKIKDMARDAVVSLEAKLRAAYDVHADSFVVQLSIRDPEKPA